MLTLVCTRTCSTCRKAVALLTEKGVPYSYREYRDKPLSEKEIRTLLSQLGIRAIDLARKRDPAWKDLGLSEAKSEDTLIKAMASHPTLVQRPIGIFKGQAVIGRPPEKLLLLLNVKERE